MANGGVIPNRRGMRSRELVLDAAERVIAEHGFDAASLAQVVEEAGIPVSSVYHYFGSKEGVLLAVMERDAHRFFADLPESDRRLGGPVHHLAATFAAAARALQRHPGFVRLVVVFAVQPPATTTDEVRAVVRRVRDLALERLRREISTAYGDDPDDPLTDLLARFALSAFDGAFVAWQAEPRFSPERLLAPLAAAVGAARRDLRSAAVRERGRGRRAGQMAPAAPSDSASG